jgi:hypothetical protein
MSLETKQEVVKVWRTVWIGQFRRTHIISENMLIGRSSSSI